MASRIHQIQNLRVEPLFVFLRFIFQREAFICCSFIQNFIVFLTHQNYFAFVTVSFVSFVIPWEKNLVVSLLLKKFF